MLVTQDHADHLAENTLPGLAQSSPDARFVVPAPLIGRLTGLGIERERVVGVKAGETVKLGAARLKPVPAMHAYTSPPAVYDFERDEQDRHTCLGYVLELGWVRVYHAGDTVIYDGMVEWLWGMNVDMALLPISGRSYFRKQ